MYITDKAYTEKQILRKEIVMITALGFNLGRPLPINFLRRNSKAGEVDAKTHTVAKYVMELCLVDYELCHVAPSITAGKAWVLGRPLRYNFIPSFFSLPLLSRVAGLRHEGDGPRAEVSLRPVDLDPGLLLFVHD